MPRNSLVSPVPLAVTARKRQYGTYSVMSATGHGSDKADEFDTRAGKLLASTSTMALRSDTFEGAMGMT